MTDLMRYDQLTQQALRQVVRQALSRVAEEGLPGDHHFFITFRTDFAGCSVPDRLKAQYPEEMTIALKSQFWDLEVHEDAFSVGLSFNQVPEALTIPFAALTRFFDPQAPFGLEFPVPESEAPEVAEQPEDLDTAEPNEGGAEVVALDAFRSKKP